MAGSLRLAVVAVVVAASASRAYADDLVLDRTAVISHAKTSAPSAQLAQSGVKEATAGTVGVGALSLDRPVIGITGGRRLAGGEYDRSLPEYGASVSFPIDLGGRAGARSDAANAELGAARADASDQLRLVVREALLRYTRAVRSQSALSLAIARRDTTAALLLIAKRRVAAGDVSETDANVVQIELVRDEAKVASQKGDVEATILALTTYVGVTGTPKVVGPLLPKDEPPTLDVLLASIEDRADVKAAKAAEVATSSTVDLAKADRWPTISLVGSWSYSELSNTFIFGVSVPLVPLNLNKTAIAVSEARAANAKTRTMIVRAQAEKELRAAYARYTSSKAAADAFAKNMGLIDGTLDAARKSYDAGKIGLADVMTARRSVADASVEKLDADVALAEARIELDAASGRLP